MKHKRNLKYFFSSLVCVFFLSAFSFLLAHTSLADYTYKPLESIPGFESAATDFPTFALNLYKFGIWVIGICALLMITVGGFMYLISAGNTSKMDSAKKIISDAILGLIIALGAYFLLFTINPDLVNVNITLKPLSGVGATSVSTGGNSTGASSGAGGTCQTVTTGVCTPDSLANTCFGSNAKLASSICMKESGGTEGIPSGMDKCQPGGEVVSWGLFQINISANKVNGLNCPSAFSKVYTASNHNCVIVNRSLYDQCVTAAKDSATNIATACSLSNGGSSWKSWANECGF
jgi:hypothetical protein